jgi:hypothetical protein
MDKVYQFIFPMEISVRQNGFPTVHITVNYHCVYCVQITINVLCSLCPHCPLCSMNRLGKKMTIGKLTKTCNSCKSYSTMTNGHPLCPIEISLWQKNGHNMSIGIGHMRQQSKIFKYVQLMSILHVIVCTTISITQHVWRLVVYLSLWRGQVSDIAQFWFLWGITLRL